jgi:ribosome biogenesis ATPase
MIDPAMVRPGRLDKLLYVDLPSPSERAEIVGTVSRGVPMAQGVREQVRALVRGGCEGFSGADLAALVREAGVCALRRTLVLQDVSVDEGGVEVEVLKEDFESALQKVNPSVSVAQRRKYQALRSKFAGLPVRAERREKDQEEGREAADPAV